MNIKIKSIELKNFKSVKYGKIDFIKSLKQIKDKNIKNKITGIYGPNGSGKSNLVDAINLLSSLFSFKNLKDENIIHIDEKECEIKYEFVLDDVILIYTITFFSENNKVKIKKDSLYLLPIIPMLKDHGINKSGIELINFNYVKANYFAHEKLAIDELNLQICGEVSRERNSNFISLKFLEYFKDKFLGLKIQDLLRFILFDLSVYLDDNRANQYNILKICKPVISLNEITTLNLNGSSIHTKNETNDFIKYIEQINEVLPSLIPDLSIKLVKTKISNDQYELNLFSKRSKNKNFIPLIEESFGIRKLIALCDGIIGIYNFENKVLVIDEFDAGIFEYLLGELIEVIHQDIKGQLIITSHNQRILEVLDQNSIYFGTMNKKNAFIKMKGTFPKNNLRDRYYQAIVLGGQDEDLYQKTYKSDLRLALLNHE